MLLLLSAPAYAGADSSDAQRTAWFNEAMAFDLAGVSDKAYAAFLKAAQHGMAEAQFNVAVMLDSGRGVGRDRRRASIWYARAAAHGNAQAAYNLALLYAAGEGVPRNDDIARSYFSTSRLPAARFHLTKSVPRDPFAPSLSAPLLMFPAEGEQLDAGSGLELVWSLPQQSEEVQFFVELVALDRAETPFSSSTVGTSILVPGANLAPGAYAWRAVSLIRSTRHYLASNWAVFRVVACEGRVERSCAS